MDEREAAAARRPILSGWVTQGPEVLAFEREFAAAVGAPHACAVSNCTAALHLAMLALGLGAGDEVVTVSHSFISTANCIRFVGAHPVFVDVQPGTYNMDPAGVERALGPRTRAVLVVHQLGMPADLGAILALARRRGLAVVEDAACASGSEIRLGDAWEKIGRPHGDIACFSFHPRKLVATGDGGMLTTARQEWDRAFRLWRHNGMGVPDTVRHGASQVIFESYPVVGYNYRLTDIQAAVGREQLGRLAEVVARRRLLAERYTKRLADVDGLGLPEEPAWARSNWQNYCVVLPDGCDQRAVMQRLLDLGIATRRGVMCAHREPSYPRGTWSCEAREACAGPRCPHLRESERIQDRGLQLPLFHELGDDDQDRVVEALREACVSRPA
jgi:dTDP-4-amino-4,6-dideoxygalactose transaminase